MQSLAIVFVLVAGTSAATATPWGERCKARLEKVVPALRSIGTPAIAIARPPPPAPGTFGGADEIGEVSLAITSGDLRFAATIGVDHSGDRYRAQWSGLPADAPSVGLVGKNVDTWHSPYDDSVNGAPPDVAAQPLLEELHHALLPGLLIRAELRIDVARPRGQGSAAMPHLRKLFADTLRPVLAACWRDVLPDEADSSLAWTTRCSTELAAADAALVKRDPVFKRGACSREPFNAHCGNIEGPEPRWNAMLLLGDGTKPQLAWTDDGHNRKSYGDNGAMLWASDRMSPAQFGELVAAFETPLEHCWQLMRANMYAP